MEETAYGKQEDVEHRRNQTSHANNIEIIPRHSYAQSAQFHQLQNDVIVYQVIDA